MTNCTIKKLESLQTSRRIHEFSWSFGKRYEMRDSLQKNSKLEIKGSMKVSNSVG